jgi:geranyl-CoA carboxylase beta subunit
MFELLNKKFNKTEKAVYNSKVNTKSNNYIDNRKDMLELVNKLRGLENRASELSERRKARFLERGQLTPRERLSKLLDPKSEYLDLYNMANYLVDDPNPDTSIPGATFIAGIGIVNGVRCLVFVDDSGINAGASTTKSVEKALGCIELALKQKLPFIHLVESAGANLLNYTVELWAKGGGMFYGLAKLSAAGIPTIAVLHGPSTAGGAYQPGMSDYVIGVKDNGFAALAGSALLKAATSEVASNEELGSSEMHSKVTGLVEYLADDDEHALEITRDLIKRLDWNAEVYSKVKSFHEPRYNAEEIAGIVPIDYRVPYDVREIVARIVDDSDFIEFKPGYGVTMVCLHARVHGHACGIVGNNGPIDPNGAAKAGHFFQLCDQANLPLIFLNNVTGYMVGKKYEQAGMIKHGAKMIQAVSNIKVPKITLYIGASFGAGNYGMCGYAYKPDFIFSWPNAVTGVMGGKQAALTMREVKIGSAKRRGIELDEKELKVQEESIISHFDSQSDAFFTSGRVLDQGIIDPRDTRRVLSITLQTCLEANKRKLKPNSYGIARM